LGGGESGRGSWKTCIALSELCCPLRMSALIRVRAETGASWMAFTVSPANVAIHTNTESESSNMITYLPLRGNFDTKGHIPIIAC